MVIGDYIVQNVSLIVYNEIEMNCFNKSFQK